MKGDHDHTPVNASMIMRSLPTEACEDNSSALFSTTTSNPPSTSSVGGLQMSMEFHHQPVLRHEIVELCTGLTDGVILDATLGGGGHAEALLEAFPKSRLVGIDRDPIARAAATQRLARFGDRVRVVDGTFGQLDTVVTDSVSVVLMDLGVSSPQLDDAARGFSFRSDAPLDMRMDTSQGMTAADFLVRTDLSQLANLLRRHGEQRFAGSIAKSILERQPTTTFELVEAVERAVPMAARRRGHVATRVFQALRVEINDEEHELESGLAATLSVLEGGGLLAVISYHSGEDQVVKAFLHEAATGGCHCPYALGCVCGAQARMIVKKNGAVMADTEEISKNPRARSARLRYGRKVSA